jgi:hypothetical protein
MDICIDIQKNSRGIKREQLRFIQFFSQSNHIPKLYVF